MKYVKKKNIINKINKTGAIVPFQGTDNSIKSSIKMK